MRVIAGKARSLPLKTPPGKNTRPTTDRIKETLFNILAPELPDSIFVDVFSGSGAIGIEAISRGARKSYFIENDKVACSCIMENLTFTGFLEQAVVLKQDAKFALATLPNEAVDVIFMDPPYDSGCEEELLATLQKAAFVTEDTQIIIEASLNKDFTNIQDLGFCVTREKKYKTNKHVFLKRS